MAGILLFVLIAAEPETLTGTVVGVHDGDTFTLLDAHKKQHKVRLAGIDAPEIKQPFGTRAKKELSERVIKKEVRVEWSKKDRNGRILGDVYDDDGWVNGALVKAGMAWHYREFSTSKELSEFETIARDKRRGLWDDKAPIPPWEWRKSRDKKPSKPPF